ncbi:DMT family protein [Ramlibacter sp. PS4R-6]|uniref:DMT family protein n=1 Tax=Ramlibacter sp. PS4R-6 TaxID=3133438 RepID=UPI00309DE9D6
MSLSAIPLSLQTILLLVASNVFMTVAWYGHLKFFKEGSAWYVVALASWGIALFEYLLQVPANRIGFLEAGYTVAQLKILQEVITLAVFVPFALFVLGQPMKMDYVWAALCMVGAVYFIFRNG